MDSIIDKLIAIFNKAIELFVFWIVFDVVLLIVYSVIDYLVVIDSSLNGIDDAIKITIGTFGLDMFSFIMAIIVLVLVEFKIIEK